MNVKVGYNFYCFCFHFCWNIVKLELSQESCAVLQSNAIVQTRSYTHFSLLRTKTKVLTQGLFFFLSSWTYDGSSKNVSRLIELRYFVKLKDIALSVVWVFDTVLLLFNVT